MKTSYGNVSLQSRVLNLKPLMLTNPPTFVDNPERNKLLFYGLNAKCLENVEKLKMFIEECSKASILQLFFGPAYDRVLVQYNDEPGELILLQ